MVSPLRLRHELYNAVAIIEDPGYSATEALRTITINKDGGVCPVVTTGTGDTRTLRQPTKAGIVGTVVLHTDGGDLTLTVTGGYNADGDTTITFGDAGDFVRFMSIDVGGTYYWRVVAQEGTNTAVETGEFDSLIAGAITGGDNSLGITGQAQATTVNGGAVVIAGAASIAGATGNGGAATVTGGASGSTAGTGGVASITGGLGTTTGAGGAATVTGGVGGSTTGNGGAATITGGAAPGSNADGGAASLTGGATTAGAAGTGGAATVAGGANANTTNGAGGLASVTGGLGKGTGAGGAASLVGGAAPGTGNGGAASVIGGATTGGATGTGGAASLTGGANANTTNGAGGAASVTGGAGKGSGAGGAASLTGGASAGSGAGGNVTLTGGASGSGIAGGIIHASDVFFAQDDATAEATGAQTIAAADFVNGIVVHSVAAASTLTTPTGAQIAAVLPAGVTTGHAFFLYVITVGTGADDISTLTAGDGDVTFVGSVTVGPNDGVTSNGATFLFRMTGANSFVGYRVS